MQNCKNCQQPFQPSKSNMCNGYGFYCTSKCFWASGALSKKLTKHGQSRTRIFHIFYAMKARCERKKHKNYGRYGGRGIKVEWASFEDFYKDMGVEYFDHVEKFGQNNTSIDRINNDGNYSKANCRWATNKEQRYNSTITKKITFNGQTKSMAEWAQQIGVTYATLQHRFCRGWSVEKALGTPKLMYK